MSEQAKPGLDWAGLPVIATGNPLLWRELTLANEYLRPESRILKGNLPRRRFLQGRGPGPRGCAAAHPEARDSGSRRVSPTPV